MTSSLHIKKIEILTKLIKKDLISLSDALILLKDEEMEEKSSSNILENFNASSYWTSNNSNYKVQFDDSSN